MLVFLPSLCFLVFLPFFTASLASFSCSLFWPSYFYSLYFILLHFVLFSLCCCCVTCAISINWCWYWYTSLRKLADTFCRITYQHSIHFTTAYAQRISPWCRRLLVCRNHCCQSLQTLHILLTGHRVGVGCRGLKTSSYANNIHLSHHSLKGWHWPRAAGD